MRLQGYVSPMRETTTFFGASITCDIRDFIQRRLHFFKIYQPNLTYFLKHRLRPGDVFVDVGANIGYFSLYASTLVGNAGEVLAIEAVPTTYALLRRNLDRNQADNVRALNVAATADDCLVEIVQRMPRNIGANAVRQSDSGVVPGRPIMDILGSTAARASVIKIDIEGSEAPVLRDLLQHSDVLADRVAIVAELSPASKEYVAEFRARGFKVYALPNSYRIGYMLTREYLRRFREHQYCEVLPVDDYRAEYADYVFERDGGRKS